MKNLNQVLAANLKRVREERSLSLAQLSELCSVSKSMLGQIERGEANPSVGTIWKIANGLRVSFTSLMSESPGQVKIISKEDAYEVSQEDGMYRLLSYFPYDAARKFEVYTIELDPKCVHISDAHVKGVEEYLVVMDGALEIEMGGSIYALGTGDAANFVSDGTHAYRNPGDRLTKVSIILYYSE